MSKRGYLCDGEMAERSNAAVLKTVVPQGTGGSNPSFSALTKEICHDLFFFVWRDAGVVDRGGLENRCPPSADPGFESLSLRKELNPAAKRDFLFIRYMPNLSAIYPYRK